MTSDFIVVENDDKADFESELHGSDEFILSMSDLINLMNGKVLATDIFGEYGIFLKLDKGE